MLHLIYTGISQDSGALRIVFHKNLARLFRPISSVLSTKNTPYLAGVNLPNRILWFFFLLVIALVIITYILTPPAGIAYYVATNGNDNNPGTLVQPWRTIQKAANTATAGSTVYVRSGIYREQVTVQSSGSPGKYITFMAYPGETPTIDGTGIAVMQPGLFNVISKQYIKVSGFSMVNFNHGGSCNNCGDDYRVGIYVTQSHHITIEKNTIARVGSPGIYLKDNQLSNSYREGDEDIVVDGNALDHTNMDLDSSIGGVGWEEAIGVTSTNNFVVRGNAIRQTYKEGIDIKDGSSYGKVYKNAVYAGAAGGTNAVGILMDPYAPYASNVDIFSNYVEGRDVGIALATEMGGTIDNVKIYNNIVTKTTNGFRFQIEKWSGQLGYRKNILVINNIFYANSNTGIYIMDIPMENVIIRNNIVSKNTNSQITVLPAIGVTVDHNLIDGSTQTFGTDYITGDPQFVNPADGDFHLQSTSPAIDAGSSINAPDIDFDRNLRPQGSGYDIGAFELEEGSTWRIPFDSFIQLLNL